MTNVWWVGKEMKFPEFPPPDPRPVKLPQYVLMNKWGEPLSHVAEQSSSSATCQLPHRAVAVLRPKCLILSTEHCARGVSWPSTAVYGAPAAGGLEMEQTWRPNPGYRWVICANQHILAPNRLNWWTSSIMVPKTNAKKTTCLGEGKHYS